MTIVILYGAHGTGKTRRAKQMLAHFNCKNIIEDWDGKTPLCEGDLAITNDEPPFNVSGAKIIHIGIAKSEMLHEKTI